MEEKDQRLIEEAVNAKVEELMKKALRIVRFFEEGCESPEAADLFFERFIAKWQALLKAQEHRARIRSDLLSSIAKDSQGD